MNVEMERKIMGVFGKWFCEVAAISMLIICTGDVEARGGRVGGRSIVPGIGSNPRSHAVRPYVRRDGRFVTPHRRSSPNRQWRDNWSTKGNRNPYTGRDGSRVSPPRRR
jgi:hypothetical protein